MLAVVGKVRGWCVCDDFLGIFLEVPIYLLHEVGVVGDIGEGFHGKLIVMDPVALMGPFHFTEIGVVTGIRVIRVVSDDHSATKNLGAASFNEDDIARFDVVDKLPHGVCRVFLRGFAAAHLLESKSHIFFVEYSRRSPSSCQPRPMTPRL